MKYTVRYILVLLLAGFSFVAFGQESDSTKVSYMPQSVRIGTDLIGLIKSNVKSDLTQFEITGDVVVSKFLLNFDYGKEERSRQGSDADYNMSGTYYRAGVDINLLKNDTEGNVIFFGGRYARANFDNDITYQTTDAIFGDISGTRQAEGLNARWLEIVTGTKVKVWKGLGLGFTCRLKFAMKFDKSTALSPFDIPGYGKAEERSYWGFNYYVFYRLPFGKREK